MAYQYRAILNSVTSSGGDIINFDIFIERGVVGEEEWTQIVHRDFDFRNQVVLDIVQNDELTGNEKKAAMAQLILNHPIIKSLTEGNEAEVSLNELVTFPVTIPLNV